MLVRRSSGLGGAIATQSDRADSIGARVGPRLYLGLLALLSLIACFLPLADHLGYELSELVALARAADLRLPPSRRNVPGADLRRGHPRQPRAVDVSRGHAALCRRLRGNRALARSAAAETPRPGHPARLGRRSDLDVAAGRA